jgi:hypothetical protein
MPISTEQQLSTIEATGNAAKIFATRPGRIDRQQLKNQLAHLLDRGRLTGRDEGLVECLRELNVLSLDQIRRVWWPHAKEATAYNRLYFLLKQSVLGGARMPAAGMKDWGLPPRKVYTVGATGWLWLKEEINPTISHRHLKRDQVLHDLLVAEIYVRLTETVRVRGEAWSVIWTGEQGASFFNGDKPTPVIAPDGLAIIQQRRGEKVATLPLFIELDRSREAHGRPSSDWGRKVQGYNRFYAHNWQTHPHLSDLPTFPWVAVITHGAQRLLNLAQAIKKHRREPVTYYLALWDDLMAEEDMLAVPAWLIITQEGQVIGVKRDQRQPFLPNNGGT